MDTFSRTYLEGLPVKQTAGRPDLRAIASNYSREIHLLGDVLGNDSFMTWRQAASKAALVDAILRAQVLANGGTVPPRSESLPVPAPEAAAATGAPKDIEQALQILRDVLGSGGVKRDEIEKIVRETVGETLAPAVGAAIKAGLVPTPIVEYKLGNLPTIQVTGHRHPQFARILMTSQICKESGRGALYVYGPAGTGKTTLAEQIAEAMGLRFGCISVTAGMAEGHILGKMLFDGRFVGTSFLDCYENGGLFLFDEIDAADSNTLLAINSAIANSFLSVPNRPENPIARRSRDFLCICAANTAGTGGDAMFNGRNPLDAATLDRFVGRTFPMGYDEAFERGILNSVGLAAWETTLRAIRKNMAERRVQRTLSTRFFQVLALHYGAGDPDYATVERALARFHANWTQPEIRKALEGTAASADEVIAYREKFAAGLPL
jgi:hypothetical protein